MFEVYKDKSRRFRFRLKANNGEIICASQSYTTKSACIKGAKSLILNAKKKSNKLFKNDKKALLTFLFIITTLAYFYPVIKHAKSKLDCEAIAKDYIIKNKNVTGINKREIRMLSTNFCYGGEEIKNLKI